MKTIKPYFFLFLISFFIVASTIILGAQPFGHSVKFVVGFVLMTVLAYLFLTIKPNSNKVAFFIIILIPPIIFIFFMLYMLDFNITNHLSLASSLAYIVGVFAGVGLYSTRQNKLILTSLIVTLLGFNLWYYTQGSAFILHRTNYGTFSGKVQEEVPTDRLLIVSESGDFIDIVSKVDEKYYIIDFWYNGCGLCFKGFPKVEKAFREFSSNNKIKLIAVDSYREGTNLKDDLTLIKEENYTFPVGFLPSKQTEFLLNIHAYPTSLIIHKGTVIFRGSFDKGYDYLKELIED